jgi:16S rRNA (cytosine1402-N4)-methyltransferase
MSGRHEPVLLAETLRFLAHGPGLYLDATLGNGGHAEALLDAEPEARLLGCDRDAEAIVRASARLTRFGDRVTMTQAAFHELPRVHAETGGIPFTGALFDLGVSSPQLDDPSRGMSFRADGPLDLRMDPSRGTSAAAWLATAEPRDVAAVLREHGDVRDAGRLAAAIVAAARAGALETTSDLVRVIAGRGARPHPRRLAQVFQALRIQVNDEMAELDSALEWLPGAVRSGGTVVTLAYHSGEDRRIKRAFRGPVAPVRSGVPRGLESRAPESPWHELTRKVVIPSHEEETRNPRARSARLRAFRRKSS